MYKVLPEVETMSTDEHGVVNREKKFLFIREWVILLYSVFIFMPVFAAPPVPFGAWSNQGGNISTGCPAGYTCVDNVTSENMLQRIITRNTTGEAYVQVIVEDSSRNNQWQNEAFVNATNLDRLPIPQVDPDDPTVTPGIVPPLNPNNEDDITSNSMNTRNSGISTQMSINQTGVNSTSFDYSYYVDSGWAVDPNEPSVNIDFHVVDTSPQNVTNDYTFVLQQKTDNRGRVTGRYYGIEALTTNSAVISTGNGGGRDDHMFVLRRAKGNYISSGSANLPPPNNGGMGGGMGMGGGTLVNPANGAGAPPDGILPNPQPGPFPQPPGGETGNPMGMGGNNTSAPGGTVTWNTGNEVQVIWIGQVCPGCGIAGMGMGGGMGAARGIYSFQQYENITSGSAAATQSLFTSAPITWTNPPFGPAPPGL